MHKFLSNFLLVIFIVVFAVPVEALAGSWTPPSGPPQDNNTPAPINVGDNDQTKIGGLNLQSFLNVLGNTNIAGDTKIGTGNVSPGFKLGVFGSISFDSNVSSDTFASYLRNNAFTGGGNFWIGRSGNPWAFGYPRVQINAREFSFLQRNNDNGQIINPPQPGHVLTALNTDGLIGWAPAPSGGGGGGGGGAGLRLMKNGTQLIPSLSMLDIAFPVGGQDMVQVTQTGPNSAQLFLNTDLMGGNGGGGGSSTFTGLTDTPANYTGSANRVLTVSPDETGVRFSPLDSILPPNGLRLTNDGQNINIAYPPGIVSDLDVSISSQDPSSPFLEVIGEPPSTAYLKFNSGKLLPAGTAGQTLWYNGQTNRWEAMSRLRHEDPFGLGPNQTVIENDNLFLDISGNLRVGKLTPNNISPTNALGVTTLQSGQTQAMSPVVNFIPHDMIPGSTQTVNLNSNTVNFSNPNDTNNQTVRFNANNIEIRGPEENNQVSPGEGRIPFASNGAGRFKWNANFTYTGYTMPAQWLSTLPGGISATGTAVAIAALTLRLPEIGSILGQHPAMPRIAVFRNEGFTILENHVSIEEGGDLFLQGIDNPASVQEASRLAHLCIDPETKKVLKCDPTGTSPVPEVYYASQTFYPGATSFTFPVAGSATVKYCAGGGGGGGGGRGEKASGGPGSGVGGGGGGGGMMGDCYIQNTTVQPGQQMTFQIGYGGSGGGGAFGNLNADGSNLAINTLAENGSPGGSTTISLPGAIIATGGLGGLRGGNGGFAVGPGGAGGGKNNPAHNWQDWAAYWHDGQDGYPVTGSPQCVSCGGIGGTGWYYREPAGVWPGSWQGGGLTHPAPSARGGGGTRGSSNNDICDYSPERFGQNGLGGSPSYGGGGGGGGYGQMSKLYSHVGCINSSLGYRGGGGGNGGTGYVQIIYPTSTAGDSSTSQTFASAGLHDFDLMTLPTNNPDVEGAPTHLNIKLWGAGGGGGSISNLSSSSDQTGGGGGGGQYKEMIWAIPEATRNCIQNPSAQGCLNSFDLKVRVGAGGNLGVSPNGAGGQGYSSYITFPVASTWGGSTSDVLTGTTTTNQPNAKACAQGGFPGTTGNPDGLGGAGASTHSSSDWQNGTTSANLNCAPGGNTLGATPGNTGNGGADGGGGASPVGTNGGGAGGRGSSRVVSGGIGQNFPGFPGQDGKVTIHWYWQ